MSLAFFAMTGFAQKLTSYNKDGKWGWKDEKGKKVVIEAKYQEITGFDDTNGLSPVKLNGKWGMIDKTGTTIIPFEYEGFGSFGSNGWVRATQGGKMGFIDKEGKIIVPFKYDVIRTSSYGEMYFVKSAGKWGMLDLSGKELTELKYDFITVFAINPYKYKATLNGQDVRISATGEEEAALGATPSSKSSPAESNASKEDKPKKIYKWSCKFCGTQKQQEGVSSSPSLSGCKSGQGGQHRWESL